MQPIPPAPGSSAVDIYRAGTTPTRIGERVYRLASLPGINVEGNIRNGFRILGLTQVQGKHFTLHLGDEQLRAMIEDFPLDRQAAAMLNLIAFANSARTDSFIREGFQKCIERFPYYDSFAFGFRIDPHRAGHDGNVRLEIDLCFSSPKGDQLGTMSTRGVECSFFSGDLIAILPLEDLQAILEYSG